MKTDYCPSCNNRIRKVKKTLSKPWVNEISGEKMILKSALLSCGHEKRLAQVPA